MYIRYFYGPKDFLSYRLSIKTGDTVDLEQFISQLVKLGYEREEQVEGRGQFAVRGGILDIFPIQLENPVRIELFDIEVDSIRVFDIENQRSVQSIEQVDILSAKEFIFTRDEANEIAQRVQSELSQFVSPTKDKVFASLLRKLWTLY